MQDDEAVGRAIGQRTHQDAVHDGEDRGVRADAEREREDNDGGEARDFGPAHPRP